MKKFGGLKMTVEEQIRELLDKYNELYRMFLKSQEEVDKALREIDLLKREIAVLKQGGNF